MSLNIFYEETEILDLNPEFFVSWLSEVCEVNKGSLGELTLIFCSDDYLLKVNQDYLEHDYYTDIITFDYSQDGVVAGDLFISVDRVKDNAVKHGVGFMNELYRVVVHGVLHLLGYKDKTQSESDEMRRKEDEGLSMIVSRET